MHNPSCTVGAFDVAILLSFHAEPQMTSMECLLKCRAYRARTENLFPNHRYISLVLEGTEHAYTKNHIDDLSR